MIQTKERKTKRLTGHQLLARLSKLLRRIDGKESAVFNGKKFFWNFKQFGFCRPSLNCCGTQGCAGGLATLDPVMRRHGLKNLGDQTGGGHLNPIYNTHSGHYALADFFDISVDQASHIFITGSGGDRIVTADEVADRIDRLLGEKT